MSAPTLLDIKEIRSALDDIKRGCENYRSAWYSNYQASIRSWCGGYNSIKLYEVEKKDGTIAICEVTMVSREEEHGTKVHDAVYVGRPIRQIMSRAEEERYSSLINKIQQRADSMTKSMTAHEGSSDSIVSKDETRTAPSHSN